MAPFFTSVKSPSQAGSPSGTVPVLGLSLDHLVDKARDDVTPVPTKQQIANNSGILITIPKVPGCRQTSIADGRPAAVRGQVAEPRVLSDLFVDVHVGASTFRIARVCFSGP